MRRILGALLVLITVVAGAPRAADAGDVIDRVDALGAAADQGSPAIAPGHRPVGIARAANGGYWVATDDGGVQSFGGAPFYGSAGAAQLASPVVGIAARPNGDGYWLVAADGGVFAYGKAPFLGSMGGQIVVAPIVGIASTGSGKGYWLVGADGDVFGFGTAIDKGGLAGQALRAAVVGIAPATGGGYVLAAADGGVFTFGGARFYGSAGDLGLRSPVTSVAASPSGNGYWLAASDGGVFTFGDAPFHGAATGGTEPVTAMAPLASAGYWLLRAPLPPTPPLPPGSGAGRRVVYSNPQQRVWLVEADGRVINSHLVSGKYRTPDAGTYHVFSKSRTAYAGHDNIEMDDMVRFAHSKTSGIPIGFHGIPRRDGQPMQSDDDLGGFRSAGCVRQSGQEAAFLYDWARVGDTVVVLW